MTTKEQVIAQALKQKANEAVRLKREKRKEPRKNSKRKKKKSKGEKQEITIKDQWKKLSKGVKKCNSFIKK